MSSRDDGRTYFDAEHVDRLREAERAVIDAAVAWHTSQNTADVLPLLSLSRAVRTLLEVQP